MRRSTRSPAPYRLRQRRSPARPTTREIPSDGTWYVHLLAVDSTGNRTVRHFGPWFAETGSVPGPIGVWQSTVQVDGYLDFANGEWQPDTELLGSDPRPGRAVSLYATWDSDDLFLAWDGPRWGPDGTGLLHLDTQTGGTTTPYGGATETLPFEADFVVVSGPDSQQLLAWNGSGWQQVNDPNFLAVHGATTATEIRIPRSAVNATGVVRLHAFVMDDSLAVRSVLPDLNPLNGPWASAYSWPGLVQDLDPNAGQPNAHHARVTIASPDHLGQIPGPGSLLRYVFNVSNLDATPLDSATLIVSGSDGLRFESLAGWPPPTDAPQDDRWFIDLGTLQPDASLFLTVTARVKQNILNTDAVTVTATVQAAVEPGEPALSTASLSHAVDGHPPIACRSPCPPAAQPCPQACRRSPARPAIRAAAVSLRSRCESTTVRGIPAMAPAPGRRRSTCPPAASSRCRARAFDVYGHAGEADAVVVAVDNEAPVASIDALPPVLGGSQARLTGVAVDPEDGSVDLVEIQIDGGPWQPVAPPYGDDGNGAASWTFHWFLPPGEGVQHSLRVRATDAAGNVGPASTASRRHGRHGRTGFRNRLPRGRCGPHRPPGPGLGSGRRRLGGGARRCQPGRRDDLGLRHCWATLPATCWPAWVVTDVPPADQLPPGTDVWAVVIEAQIFPSGHPQPRHRPGRQRRTAPATRARNHRASEILAAAGHGVTNDVEGRAR